mgnify:CR=1 FL=1
MTTRYLLDTNTVSYIIKGQPIVVQKRLALIPMSDVYISSITEAELLRGIQKHPQAVTLHKTVKEFLRLVESISWCSKAAQAYAQLRSTCDQRGKQLGTMDILIASHALSLHATLVTSDQAFYHLNDMLSLENWTIESS